MTTRELINTLRQGHAVTGKLCKQIVEKLERLEQLEPGPLFRSLRNAYYTLFAAGEKTVELRAYGPRWNERTCFTGREVVLSNGYRKAGRLAAVIERVRKVPGRELSDQDQAALEDCLGYVPEFVCAIHLRNVRPQGA